MGETKQASVPTLLGQLLIFQSHLTGGRILYLVLETKTKEVSISCCYSL